MSLVSMWSSATVMRTISLRLLISSIAAIQFASLVSKNAYRTSTSSAALARRCLEILTAKLSHNMANLDASERYVARVDSKCNALPQDVVYASRFWATHVCDAIAICKRNAQLTPRPHRIHKKVLQTLVNDCYNVVVEFQDGSQLDFCLFPNN
ncbi:hypothetical protein HDU83_009503 [Entophlyctis luteolus]|nr:hypothetical protein HDU83_009503 [Entophlyctis luteolus]